MNKIFLISILIGMSELAMAGQNFSAVCKNSHSQKNQIELKVKADFEIGRHHQGLEESMASVRIKMDIKAQLNDKEIYAQELKSEGQYRKVSGDDVAFSEKISGRTKDLQFEYLLVSEKEGSMYLSIDKLLENGERLDCKVK